LLRAYSEHDSINRFLRREAAEQTLMRKLNYLLENTNRCNDRIAKNSANKLSIQISTSVRGEIYSKVDRSISWLLADSLDEMLDSIEETAREIIFHR
jgi:uncharacterized protein with HEPN domain